MQFLFVAMFILFVHLQELVLEKETRIRESMLMMGLSQWVLWSTWYLKQFIFLFISILIMTILIKVSGNYYIIVYTHTAHTQINMLRMNVNTHTHTILHMSQVAVFPRSDFILLLVFFFLFTLSSISWGFLVR